MFLLEGADGLEGAADGVSVPVLFGLDVGGDGAGISDGLIGLLVGVVAGAVVVGAVDGAGVAGGLEVGEGVGVGPAGGVDDDGGVGVFSADGGGGVAGEEVPIRGGVFHVKGDVVLAEGPRGEVVAAWCRGPELGVAGEEVFGVRLAHEVVADDGGVVFEVVGGFSPHADEGVVIEEVLEEVEVGVEVFAAGRGAEVDGGEEAGGAGAVEGGVDVGEGVGAKVEGRGEVADALDAEGDEVGAPASEGAEVVEGVAGEGVCAAERAGGPELEAVHGCLPGGSGRGGVRRGVGDACRGGLGGAARGIKVSTINFATGFFRDSGTGVNRFR